MYFSRATLVSAIAGFATAQSASSIMASETMMATVSGAMMESASTPAAMMASETAATASGSIALSTAVSAMPSAAAGMVNTHIVQVGGPNGSLTFLPDNVVAQPGDLVQFQFHPKNHSVVQSTFDNPCVPIQNIMANKTDAFFSGFMPTNASFTATSQVLTYTIRVKDAKPVWFYCSQGKHCQAGMVGAINAPASGNKTMSAFIALAAQASENLSPGQATGSGGSTSGNTPVSPSAGSGAGAGAGTDTSGTAGSGAAGASGTTSSGPAQVTANSASGLSAQSFVGAMVGVGAAFALL